LKGTSGNIPVGKIFARAMIFVGYTLAYCVILPIIFIVGGALLLLTMAMVLLDRGDACKQRLRAMRTKCQQFVAYLSRRPDDFPAD
jgi:hypothetical protein